MKKGYKQVQKTFQKMQSDVGIQDAKNYTNKSRDQMVQWIWL